MIRALADAVLAALVAPTCAICDTVLERPLDGAACAACWARVVVYTPPLCRRCGEPLASERTALVTAGTCRACSVDLGDISAARSIGAFDGVLADLVLACKYGRRPTLADGLGRRLRDVVAAWALPIDIAVPVPLHRSRLRERGFNQAEQMARGLGLPVCLALERRRATAPQVGASGPARRANVRGAFTLSRQARHIAGRRVALIDDVITTGATLVAAADALAPARPLEIVALTAARATLIHRDRTVSRVSDRRDSGESPPAPSP